jgi:hypothetical protein
MPEFEDINIVDLDTSRSHQSGAATGMFDMYLSLSSTPPSAWSQIFDQERSFPRHSMWRRARISGKHIMVHCAPEEIEKYHLNDLKQDVKNANEKYRLFLLEQQRRQAREAEATSAEQQRLADIKGRLKF